jgi:hypothetical protein
MLKMQVERRRTVFTTALQRRSDLWILRNETGRPRSPFPHSVSVTVFIVSVSDLYIPTIGPPNLLQQNR